MSLLPRLYRKCRKYCASGTSSFAAFRNAFADSGVLPLPAFFIHIRYKIRIGINNSYELNNALEYAAYAASEGQNEKKKQNRKRFCT